MGIKGSIKRFFRGKRGRNASVAGDVASKELDAQMREQFDLVDQDQSGYISASELGALLRMRGELITDAQVLTIIRELEALDDDSERDADEQISYQEFTYIFTELQKKEGEDDGALVIASHIWGENGPPKDIWPVRIKMAHFVDSGNTRLGLFVLVVFDMFLVWGELLLIFTACAPCEAAARAGLALEHHDGDELGHDAAGAHEAHAAHSHNVHGLSPKQMVWEHGMHRISNLILFTLAGHLLLSFAAYGPAYLKSWYNIFDIIVVSVAVGMELANFEYGVLVILLMVWRVLRLIHAFFLAMELEHHNRSQAVDKALSAGKVSGALRAAKVAQREQEKKQKEARAVGTKKKPDPKQPSQML